MGYSERYEAVPDFIESICLDAVDAIFAEVQSFKSSQVSEGTVFDGFQTSARDSEIFQFWAEIGEISGGQRHSRKMGR